MFIILCRTRQLNTILGKIQIIIHVAFIISFALHVHAEEESASLKDDVIKKEEKLSDIDKKIEKEKGKITQAEQEERAIVNQLHTIDKKLSKDRDELTYLRFKVKKLGKEVSDMDTQINQVTRDIARQKAQFYERLVALYKYERSGGLLRVIFSSHSYLDLSQRIKFIGMILNRDSKTVHHFLEQSSRLSGRKKTLGEKLASLEKLEIRIVKNREKAGQKKKKKTALLKKVRDEKQLYLTAVQELEKSSLELQKLIDRFKKKEKTRKDMPSLSYDGKGFAALKGKLRFPVAGKIISRYGNHVDPQLNTVIFQKGIEIETEWGKEVLAVYNGLVLYADWFKGYGNTLIIDHGESYYSVFAHLSEALKSAGDRVEAGEAIARAGDTGSLKGTCLYFELRHHGKPLNPLEWLHSK